MFKLVQNELMKMFKRPGTYVMIGLLLLMISVAGGVLKYQENTATGADSQNWKQGLQIEIDETKKELKDMAVIVSSHLLSEMEMMCDRIGIIQKGKLIDVQLVEDFVHGSEQTYELEASPKEKVLECIQKRYPNIKVQMTSKGVSAPLIKDEINQIITRLVQKGKINREQAAEYMKAFIM